MSEQSTDTKEIPAPPARLVWSATAAQVTKTLIASVLAAIPFGVTTHLVAKDLADKETPDSPVKKFRNMLHEAKFPGFTHESRAEEITPHRSGDYTQSADFLTKAAVPFTIFYVLIPPFKKLLDKWFPTPGVEEKKRAEPVSAKEAVPAPQQKEETPGLGRRLVLAARYFVQIPMVALLGFIPYIGMREAMERNFKASRPEESRESPSEARKLAELGVVVATGFGAWNTIALLWKDGMDTLFPKEPRTAAVPSTPAHDAKENAAQKNTVADAPEPEASFGEKLRKGVHKHFKNVTSVALGTAALTLTLHYTDRATAGSTGVNALDEAGVRYGKALNDVGKVISKAVVGATGADENSKLNGIGETVMKVSMGYGSYVALKTLILDLFKRVENHAAAQRA